MRGIPIVISDCEELFNNEKITITETGKLYKGFLPIVGGLPREEVIELLNQIHDENDMSVYINADTAHEVDMGIDFVNGVGLVRVENMATTTEEDFYYIAKASKGKEVIFRITKPFDKEQIKNAYLGSIRADITPRILIPHIADAKNEVADVILLTGLQAEVGCMIESVNSAKNAREIAKESNFISIGTNCLAADYYEIERDSTESTNNKHFITISDEVLEIISLAVCEIKEVNPDIKIGICGRHADDIESVAKFKTIGIDYVSVSPPKAPIVKFAISNNRKPEEAKKLILEKKED